MIQIRPITDLRNKFTEIESIVKEGEPVFLTKNGYGSMVVMSLDQYSRFTDATERMLDETDQVSAASQERFSHEQAFGKIRESIDG